MNRDMVKWTVSTWVGWVVGIPLILILNFVGSALGVPENQAVIGIGMGLTLGLVQAGMMKGLLREYMSWVWMNMLGLGVGFFVWDLVREPILVPLEDILSLMISAGTAGIASGLLMDRLINKGRWTVTLLTPIVALGWMGAAVMVAASDYFPTSWPMGVQFYLAAGLILAAGLSVGIASSFAIKRLVPDTA